MKQHKRLSGDEGLGYYTSWNKGKANGCIYCGKPANTREHVPSKAFLSEAFPDNLPTIPACFDCNNGYSNDEKYVSSYLEILKSFIYEDYVIKPNICNRLEKDQCLKELIYNQIQKQDDKVKFTFDEERFINIIVKLARGHVAYELDYVDFDKFPRIWYRFEFQLAEEERREFDTIPLMDKAPEVGSRWTSHIGIIEDESGLITTFSEWNVVEDNTYRYNTYISDNRICVKFCIGEFLFCYLEWDA
ncbi:MAG: hypothetical protein VB095_07765 [Anaerovorax sp.]|nr:hypothetical protein [Anaerovorax sp.]